MKWKEMGVGISGFQSQSSRFKMMSFASKSIILYQGEESELEKDEMDKLGI